MCRWSGAKVFVSIAKLNDRCFCYFTAAMHMFVPLWRAQTWRDHTKLYRSGWDTSKNARMENSSDVILGEVVYIAIIYYIPDSCLYLLNGYNFSFDQNWWKPRIIQHSKRIFASPCGHVISSISFNKLNVLETRSILFWPLHDISLTIKRPVAIFFPEHSLSLTASQTQK